MRDSQRSKLYAWEATTFPNKCGEVLTLDECTALARKAVQRYGSTGYPAVLDGRGSRSARAGHGEINLPKWARNPLIVLHETAHILVTHLARRHAVAHGAWAAHGPEFVRVFLSLLDAFGVEPKDPGGSLVSRARRAGLKVAPPGGLVPMPAIAHKRWLQQREALLQLEAQRRALEAEVEATRGVYLRQSKAEFCEAVRASADRRARGRARAAAGALQFPVKAASVDN